MRHRAIIGALLLVGLGVALGATVFRSDIARATGFGKPPSTVIVGNTAANAVPVEEQGTVQVHAQGTVQVHEQGTAQVHEQGMVTVTSTDDPARRPFAFFKNESYGSAEDSHFVSFTVPSGKRLVIQSVSVNAAVDTGSGQHILTAAVQAHVNGQLEDYIMAPTFTGTSTSARDIYTVSQPVTIYADPATEVLIFTSRDAFSGGATMNASVQGYLIDCGAGPCN
jgi:hypothetical protein